MVSKLTLAGVLFALSASAAQAQPACPTTYTFIQARHAVDATYRSWKRLPAQGAYGRLWNYVWCIRPRSNAKLLRVYWNLSRWIWITERRLHRAEVLNGV